MEQPLAQGSKEVPSSGGASARWGGALAAAAPGLSKPWIPACAGMTTGSLWSVLAFFFVTPAKAGVQSARARRTLSGTYRIPLQRIGAPLGQAAS